MRIEQLEFRDTVTGWHLEPTTFYPHLTLLVGGSGVGKTQILRSVLMLQYLTRRVEWDWVVNGMVWDIHITASGRGYRWQGEIERREDAKELVDTLSGPINPNGLTVHPKIVRERLLEGETTLIERDQGGFWYRGVKMPKLSPSVSGISLFREEEVVAPIFRAFRNVFHLTHDSPTSPRPAGIHEILKRYRDLKSLQESDHPAYVKLVAVQTIHPETFHEIAARFQEVFPLVEGVRVSQYRSPAAIPDVPDVQIKERGVGEWIPQDRISSGMMRTLLHLAAFALSPADSVILIDEFENSLGVNCLDEVTQDMISHSRQIQFIVTSHHPYIINNIPPKNWKVVTRAGGNVKTLSAEQIGIGRSRHQAFVQLINSPAFLNAGAAG